MATHTDDLTTISAYGSFGINEERAFKAGDCPRCGAHQFMVIARSHTGHEIWLRCIQCKLAAALNRGAMSPRQKPLRVPAGLPEEESDLWGEIRECLGVGAYTASVMLCRKLLMHVAVTNGLPSKDAKDHAPSFALCVNHLVSEGVITKRMQPWIDRIREVGNEANHEIVPVREDAALDVATFTQKLLELAYEMDDTMAKARPDDLEDD